MHTPIVFIHGSGDSARIWRLQVEGLGKDYSVFAIDLPGHGERVDTLPESVTVLDYAKAAHEIMQNELDLDHPIIAGHSLGGAVALTMALEYGAELGGLILMGTGARLRVHPSLLEAAQATPGPNMLYRDLAACNAFDCMARMHEISLPTLVICGADDGLTPVKYSQFLHDRLGNSTLCIIPGAGQYVMREQAELVNQAISEWMEKI